MTFLRYEVESLYSIIPFLPSGPPHQRQHQVGRTLVWMQGRGLPLMARHCGKFQSALK